MFTPSLVPIAALMAVAGGRAAEAAGDRGPQLVVSVGDVRLEPAGNGEQYQLQLGPKAAARLLMDRSLLALGGPARVLVGRGRQREPRVRVLSAGVVTLEGAAQLVTPLGWRVQTAWRGTLVLQRERVMVAGAPASVEAPGGGWLGLAASGGRTRSIAAGQCARLGADGELTLGSCRGGRLAAARRRTLAAYTPPPRWEPAVSQVTPGQAGQAVRLVRRRQQAREIGSCGCTEDSSSGDVGLEQGPTGQLLEKRNATLRVRVNGVPRVEKR